MTGFGAAEGVNEARGLTWRWDVRSVNGKSLDLRFRTPSGWDRGEEVWRGLAAGRLHRGTVTLNLTVGEVETARAGRVNPKALEAALEAARRVADAAAEKGLFVAPASPAELLAIKGVWEADAAAPSEPLDAEAFAACGATLEAALAGLLDARASEGARLREMFETRLSEIEALIAAAQTQAAARSDATKTRLRERVAALLEAGAELEPARLAQELALLAVKNDVSEELDRLTAHVAAARELLASDAPIGRKFEFLIQEFNREANTLCSKAQNAALTETGLTLKLAIDQMREQAANVE